MTTTPPEAPTGPPPPPGPSGPRVTREEARDLGSMRRTLIDRKIGGVAGGVARHFDIDPLIVRVAFVLLAIFGGGGLLAYAAGWLLIPEEGTDHAVIRVDHRTRTVLLGIVGIVCALSLVGDSLGGWDFPWPLVIVGLVIAAIAAGTRQKPHPGPLPAEGWVPPAGTVPPPPPAAPSSYSTYRPVTPPAPGRPRDPRKRGPILFWFTMGMAFVAVAVVATFDLAGWDAPPSAYPAAVLAACGVMLVVGAFYGRAGGLILIGLIAALVTLTTSAVDEISAGQIDARPTSAADVDHRYYVGAGEIIVDLTDLSATELEELDGRTIEAEARFGHVLIQVPERGLDVTVHSDVQGGGESVLFGSRRDNSYDKSYDGGVNAPDITLDLTVLFGQVEVETKEAVR